MKAPLIPKRSAIASAAFRKMASGRDADLSDNSLTPTSLYVSINGNPTELTLTVVESGIQLDWVNGSTNETGILIERSLDRLAFSGLTVVGNGIATFTDETVDNGTEYFYRVMAFKGNSYSVKSNVVEASMIPEGVITFEGDTELLTFEGDTELITFET